MSENSRQNFLNRLRIRKDLEKFTAGALSRHGDIDALVARIATLERPQQDFIYEWAELVARANTELAAHFVYRSADAFEQMPRDGVQDWLDDAMTTFDNRGLGFAIEVLESVDEFARRYGERHVRCDFQDASTFLRHFVRGLGGRELRLTTDDSAFTDTEALYLPDAVNLFPDSEQNFSLYKLTAVHLWAQTWYGTWRYGVLERLQANYDDELLLRIFNNLECIRLDACIERDFPGLARQFAVFGHTGEEGDQLWARWRERAEALLRPGASAEDSLNLIGSFAEMTPPPPKPYQGAMFAARVRQTLMSRVEREKSEFQKAMQELRGKPDDDGDGAGVNVPQDVEIEAKESPGEGDAETTLRLSIDGDEVNLPEHLRDLVGSIMQDFGEIPDEHMEPVELGDYSDELLAQGADENPALNAEGDDKSTFTYREWDCVRQRFREGFCTLRELGVAPGDESFIDDTLEKHRGVLKSIKRSFEAVLGESRLQRRQSDGDDIDIDAVIEAIADMANGREMSEYLYTRYRNQERNIAVMFMVDMSGSTLGWVNDAERESLVLLCEALQMLGDRYAIYGFSGRTNKRCEVYHIKDFNESYTQDVKQRIAGIRPKAYTRMGVAIRHLGQMLQSTQARTKLLITLSDGRPEDYGGYKGKYGIEDTRHALLELKQAGIHAYCITIDNEAQEYLPHMYGTANFAVIDEVSKLPYKVADIYRRLTT